MRKAISFLVALCLMIIPAMSFAENYEQPSSYVWSDASQFDLYDLGFSIVMPEGWKAADDATLAMLNGEDENGNLIIDPEATSNPDGVTLLYPYVIAMMSNADDSVHMVISCEELDGSLDVTNADQYLTLFANDIVATNSAEGITSTYDPQTISDATLVTQSFRELAISSSDGTMVDILTCYSGVGVYYTFSIMGNAEALPAFAGEFVNSIKEIDAMG